MKTLNLNRRVPSLRSRSIFGLVLFLGLGLLAGAAQAGEKKEAKAKKEKAKKTEEVGKVVITGSNIPQRIKLERTPKTASPVVIIDRRDIDRTGATTMADLFGRQSAFR